MIRSLAFLSFLFLLTSAYAQVETKTYTSVFVPYSVTYNGSDNPNECWESVAQGVLIKEGTTQHFFYLPYGVMDSLQQTAGTSELIFEVVFYEPLDASGLDGSVIRITQNGTVLYSDR